MWRAIDRMSKDVQELIQRDVGTDDEEDRETLPAIENPAKEEPVPTETSTIAHPTLEKTVPTGSFFSIPEEDVVSVKDSVTS